MAGTKLELLYYEGGTWANARYRWWKTALDPDDWESNAGDQGTDINPVTQYIYQIQLVIHVERKLR